MHPPRRSPGKWRETLERGQRRRPREVAVHGGPVRVSRGGGEETEGGPQRQRGGGGASMPIQARARRKVAEVRATGFGCTLVRAQARIRARRAGSEASARVTCDDASRRRVLRRRRRRRKRKRMRQRRRLRYRKHFPRRRLWVRLVSPSWWRQTRHPREPWSPLPPCFFFVM